MSGFSVAMVDAIVNAMVEEPIPPVRNRFAPKVVPLPHVVSRPSVNVADQGGKPVVLAERAKKESVRLTSDCALVRHTPHNH